METPSWAFISSIICRSSLRRMTLPPSLSRPRRSLTAACMAIRPPPGCGRVRITMREPPPVTDDRNPSISGVEAEVGTRLLRPGRRFGSGRLQPALGQLEQRSADFPADFLVARPALQRLERLHRGGVADTAQNVGDRERLSRLGAEPPHQRLHHGRVRRFRLQALAPERFQAASNGLLSRVLLGHRVTLAIRARFFQRSMPWRGVPNAPACAAPSRPADQVPPVRRAPPSIDLSGPAR